MRRQPHTSGVAEATATVGARGDVRPVDRTPSPIHRLAVAGNTAALVMLVLMLANGSVLFDSSIHPRPVAYEAPPGPLASRAVLVIIDGLRQDFASDPAVMPALRELARRGVETTAHVQALIPSTIAGITTLATGAVPPPVSFVNDFRSSPARSGGVFQTVAEAGGTSFVAGPGLWTDLYAEWIAASYRTPAIGSDDAGAVEAVVAALSNPTHRLYVLHLGATDEMAHKDGAISREHTGVVRWCDDAVGRIAAAAGSDTLLVVTSDHGLTARGGHAGPEPEVLRTPLVLAGAGAPGSLPGDVTQSAVPALLLNGLGLHHADTLPLRPAPPLPLSIAWVALCACVALWPAMRLWRQLTDEPEGRVRSFFLNAFVWVALALVALGWRSAALAAVLGVLLACGSRARAGRAGFGLPLSIGIMLGAVRVLDALHALGRERALLEGASGLAIACIVGLLAGASLGRLLYRSGALMPLAVAIAIVVSQVALTRLLGNTASLSTIDVRIAYAVGEGPLGIPGAAIAVFLVQAAPVLSGVVGIAPAWSRLSAPAAGRLAASLAAVLSGQALFSALLLSSSPDHAWCALGLGLMLRTLAELSYFFLGAAISLALVKAGSLLLASAARGR